MRVIVIPGKGSEYLVSITMKRFAFLALASLIGSAPESFAHDQWSNGEPVPRWVKAACCGPEDAHHLQSTQVQQGPDGWRVDGYRQLIPNGRELPSLDGTYWIFYRNLSDGSQSKVYCFFVPIPSM
jgi:hypothetical protein